MTKEKLEARVKELEEMLNIKQTPTKMDEIEALETSTMVDVLDLIRNCEKVTGRSLKTASSKVEFSLDIKESHSPLRTMVEEMTNFAMCSGKYDFHDNDSFAQWVYSKIVNN